MIVQEHVCSRPEQAITNNHSVVHKLRMQMCSLCLSAIIDNSLLDFPASEAHGEVVQAGRAWYFSCTCNYDVIAERMNT